MKHSNSLKKESFNNKYIKKILVILPTPKNPKECKDIINTNRESDKLSINVSVDYMKDDKLCKLKKIGKLFNHTLYGTECNISMYGRYIHVDCDGVETEFSTGNKSLSALSPSFCSDDAYNRVKDIYISCIENFNPWSFFSITHIYWLPIDVKNLIKRNIVNLCTDVDIEYVTPKIDEISYGMYAANMTAISFFIS